MARLAALENRLTDVEKLLTTQEYGQPLLPAPLSQPGSETLTPGRQRWFSLPIGYVALLAAYATVVFWLDLPLSVLRLSSILVPFGTGFIYFGSRFKMRWFDICVAFAFACLTVLSMNAILAAVDAIPVLPQETAAWRESMYYVVSIAASMFSGMLLRMSIMTLGARGLTSLPGLRQGLLIVNKSIPSDTLKAIEMAVLLIGTVVSGIAGLFAGLIGLTG